MSRSGWRFVYSARATLVHARRMRRLGSRLEQLFLNMVLALARGDGPPVPTPIDFLFANGRLPPRRTPDNVSALLTPKLPDY